MTTPATPPPTTSDAPPAAREPAPARKTPLWAKLLLVFVVLLLIAGATIAGLAVGKLLGAGETRDVQVVRSVTQQEQVILVSAGITEIAEEQGDPLNIFGLFDLPLTERNLLVRYEFDAKFGIDGQDVDITRTGGNAYRISIPEFEFLGYDNPDLEVAKEENGILSWTTPEIDKFEVVEQVLTDEAVAEHIDGFRPVLEDQARTFYSSIIMSIDPEVELEFEFAG
ncbi:hypothetical protein [Agromyces sp. SYSU T0242]|uniref:hypothetical protein n=1 Tax=Agromyces litoreus TaxID=3158561 RepID=UPI00339B48F0